MLFPRDLLFLTLGLAFGAGAAILVVTSSPSPTAQPRPPSAPQTPSKRADSSFVSNPSRPAVLPQSDTDTLLAKYNAAPLGEARETLLVDLIQALTKNDPKSALAFLTSEDPEGLVPAAYLILGKEWATLDPRAASAWTSSLTNPDTQEAAVRGVCEGWAASQPLEAFRWINSFPSPNAREIGLVQVARLWSRVDPQGALSHFAATPKLSREVLDEFAASWGRSATKEAVQALVHSSIPNSDDLVALALTSGSLENPNVAIQSLPVLRNTELRARTRQNILRQVAAENPKQAIQLAALSGGLDPTGAAAIASGWAQEDTKAAMQWIATLPPQIKTQTFAAAALASYTQEEVDVKQILQSLPLDPSIRHEVMKHLAEFEAARSPERLQYFLESIPPSAERDRLKSDMEQAK